MASGYHFEEVLSIEDRGAQRVERKDLTKKRRCVSRTTRTGEIKRHANTKVRRRLSVFDRNARVHLRSMNELCSNNRRFQ